MRPMSFVLALAVVLMLAPGSAFAGKGGGGDDGFLEDPVDGDFFFLDKLVFDKIRSVASIDSKSGEFCLNAIAIFVDTTTTLNRRVEWEFLSNGNVVKSGPGKVVGEFTGPIELRLSVFCGPENTAEFIFDGTLADANCSLDAALSKIGEDGDENLTGQIKADLVCDLGPQLADFDIPASVPDCFAEKEVITQEEILATISFALANRKAIKIKTKTGDFQIKHNGNRVDPDADGYNFLALTGCSDEEPPPPPPE
jgi:hypothetical protein